MEGVAPIVRGEFVYRDTIFVDVGGEGKRHPRAAETELASLLNGTASKDQVAHFYEAQLIHYGLQRSKNKDTAKVHLLQALNQGKLLIPPHMTDTEAQMRKEEFEEDEDLKKTKISMEVGDITVNIEQNSLRLGTAPKKTAKASASSKAEEAPEVTPKKPAAKVASQTSPTKQRNAVKTPKKVASKAPSTKDATQAKAEQEADEKTRITPNKKQTGVKKEPVIKPEPRVKKEAAVKRGKMVKHDPTEEDDTFSHPNIPGRPRIHDDHNITGVYNLECEQVAEQFQEYANNFRLFLCLDGDTIWGGFELANKSGVLRIDDIKIEQSVPFGWRARDTDSGRLKFGRGCFGEIELYGTSEVRGIIHNLFPESVGFDGHRRPGPLWCGRTAESFQREWDGFVNEAYGR